MASERPGAHPYMPNSVPDTKAAMLAAVGAGSVEELFAQIPADHRLKAPLRLPPALRAEGELRRHLEDLLARNETCETNLSFLGGGCWQHYVPAVCDEIAGRSEFLTNVWGTASSDHGRNQAWFEYASQLGELVGADLVGLPVYSWGCAAGHAIRMASRLTGRREVLVPRAICPERLSVIRNYCEPAEMPSHIAVVPVDYDPATGLMRLDDLAAKLSTRTAAVYLENPTYLGADREPGGRDHPPRPRQGCAHDRRRRPDLARRAGGPDATTVPTSSSGTTQPLGIPMYAGGGVGGFIASRDEERFAREYPTLLISITGTTHPGERGFGLSLRAPDLLRDAGPGQGLDRQLGLPLGRSSTPSTWRCSGRRASASWAS